MVPRWLCDAVGLSPDPDGSLLLHEDYGEPPVAEPSVDIARSPQQPPRGRFCSVAHPRCDFGDPQVDDELEKMLRTPGRALQALVPSDVLHREPLDPGPATPSTPGKSIPRARARTTTSSWRWRSRRGRRSADPDWRCRSDTAFWRRQRGRASSVRPEAENGTRRAASGDRHVALVPRATRATRATRAFRRSEPCLRGCSTNDRCVGARERNYEIAQIVPEDRRPNTVSALANPSRYKTHQKRGYPSV